MIYNFHTHTFRCAHATGTERNYIERAISMGIKKMGFSDHIPFMHTDGFEIGYRVKTSDALDYFNTLKALREEYKSQIKIYIGFETEYYPAYFDKMITNALELGAEYFILGQHQLKTDRADGYEGQAFFPPLEKNNNQHALAEYVDALISGVKSGYVSYVAHPDAYNFCGEANVYINEYSRLLNACKQFNVPIEINCLGIRTNRHYPNAELWKLAGQIGTPVVIGMDAHDEHSAYDENSVAIALDMADKYKLNILLDYEPKLL